MKIVMLRSNPISPDPRVEKEANSLLKGNFKVTLVAWDRNECYSIKKDILKLSNGNSEIVKFGIPSVFGDGFKKNLIPLLKFQVCLIKWLIRNRNEYDVIHACDFDTVIPAYICSKLFKKRYVYDIFDYYVDAYSVPRKLKKFIEKIDHKMINSSDATIICTEKRQEQIRGTKPKKLIVIHNSPNSENLNLKVEHNRTLLGNKTKVVYVGILNDGRYILELVDMIKDSDNYELHIGGFGKYEDTIKAISQTYNNIKFYGKIPYEKTLELESMCDIMTAIYDPNIPNHYYAAPNKFYEALMLGKPIIMVKNTGMDDIVIKNNIGEVAEYDAMSIKGALLRLENQKNEWNNISGRMKKLYNDNYRWSKMEERLIKLYHSI